MSQNIKPSVWGPHGWKFLHYVSLGAPDKLNIEEANHYRNFYESLQYILPCKSCAKNYAQNIKDHPINDHLKTRDDLVNGSSISIIRSIDIDIQIFGRIHSHFISN